MPGQPMATGRRQSSHLANEQTDRQIAVLLYAPHHTAGEYRSTKLRFNVTLDTR